MNKTLLKQMASEVSVKTLGGMLVNYAEMAAEFDEVTEEMLNVVDTLETLIAELKSRGGIKPEKKRDSRRKNGGDSDGSVRTESGELQREQSAATPTIRVGNGALREQL
ncbi:hypothetical protein [Paenibacillus sp. YIM B09110]|uniref:hypothetical protein n=1 Tax=Paenibacillus sp. YIM B09110 TaxID=3126102 RepID=UPI00301DA550